MIIPGRLIFNPIKARAAFFPAWFDSALEADFLTFDGKNELSSPLGTEPSSE
jgi:hypothetical protein